MHTERERERERERVQNLQVIQLVFSAVLVLQIRPYHTILYTYIRLAEHDSRGPQLARHSSSGNSSRPHFF